MKLRVIALVIVALPLFVPLRIVAASIVFTGKVITPQGEALIGVNVLIPGTSQGTVTDVDGFFQLEVPEGTTELYISYSCFGDNTLRWCGQFIGLIIIDDRKGPVSYDAQGRTSCGWHSRTRKTRRWAADYFAEILAHREKSVYTPDK